MDPTWPDCPHPQCDARNPTEALYCARCGRPQYQSPGWQEHAIAKANRGGTESTEGAVVVVFVAVILICIAMGGALMLIVRT